MAKSDYPTTKKVSAFRRPDGSLRPTWDYRGVEIDGLGLKGFVIAIRGRPTCVTLGEARDRIDAYHRRRAGQARRRVLALLETTAPAACSSGPLQPGNVFELPPGTEIRSGDTAAPEPEQDNLALCLRSADDLANGYDCRVQVVGVDDARLPMSVEHDEGDHIVVTDRHSGRVVGLVQAWVSDYGDPIVPKQWLEIVLSAWDVAKEPQWAV